MPEDYVMRMVEQTSIMLAAIINHRKVGLDTEAMQDVEKACLQRVGLPLSLIKKSSPEQIFDLMQQGGGFYVRSILLAELLLQDGELNEKTGKIAEALRSQLQAFCLLVETIDVLSSDEKVIYQEKLDKLVQKLKVINADPYLQKRLADYKVNSTGQP